MRYIKNWSVQYQILFMFLMIILVTTSTIVYQAYSISKGSLDEKIHQHLISAQKDKKISVLSYLGQVKDQVATFSQGFTAIMAMELFDFNFKRLESETMEISERKLVAMEEDLARYYEKEFFSRYQPNTDDSLFLEDFLSESRITTYLQNHYIVQNSFPTGKKDELYQAMDGSQYSDKHEKFHDIFRQYLERFGYYDIFLVNLEGDIVYSVYKEVDFATNLLWGPYAGTNIGKVFKQAKESNESDHVAIADYEFYPPSYGAPAAFIASPIFKGKKKIGVLIFQMPVERINKIMTSGYDWATSGMGRTGEIYLAAVDGKMRSTARQLVETPEIYFEKLERYGYQPDVVNSIKRLNTSILSQPVAIQLASTELNSQEEEVAIIQNYLGDKVVSCMSELDFEGLKWFIISEIHQEEAMEDVVSLRKKLMLWSVGLFLLAFVGSSYFSLNFVKPLKEVNNKLDELSMGVIPDMGEKDFTKSEVGNINRAASMLAKSQEQIREFSVQIGKGNLESQFEPRSEEDGLGFALLKMRDRLSEAQEQERQRHWVSNQLAKFNDIIRENNNFDELCKKVASYLSEAFGAQQIWIYIHSTGEEDVQPHLKLVACYAWSKHKFVQKEIIPGEGLVGQVFLEKKALILDTIPNGYASINSGIGETDPGFLAIVPLLSNEVAIGVVEVAAFEKLPAYMMEMLEKSTESLATSMISLKQYEQTKKISEAAKLRELSIKESEEKLRQSNIELMEVQEMNKKKEKEYLDTIKSLKEHLETNTAERQ